jgi:activator of HSP90 ATPase
MYMSKSIRQSVEFTVSPHEIYEALMDSKKHAEFTGSAAGISRKINGKYSAYDGYITGRNLELIPDKKIVQEWHAVDWEPGQTSQVTFELTPIPTGTRLDFTHTGLPEGTEAEFTQGWIDNYWQPMQKMFSGE